MTKISGNHMDDQGLIIPHAVGDKSMKFFEVFRRGNLFYEWGTGCPVKAIRSPEGNVYIVDNTSPEWDGPVFGGTFVADAGEAERAGMIDPI